MIAVHIGLKRCGSASIQYFLSANERPLQRLAVDYTRIGRQLRPSHGNFAAELRDGENFDSSLGSLSDLVKHWRSTAGTLKIISAEKRRLQGLGEEIRIVMVIRDLAGLLPSLYVQRIKRGHKYFDFDRFFELHMSKKIIDYLEIARPWAEMFGWGNLRVRVLDAGTLVNGDLIDDFLAALDVDPGDPRLQSLVRPGVFNVTDDWRVVEALRALHKGDVRLAAGHPLSLFLARADRKFDQGCVERMAVEVGERLGWSGDKGDYLTRPHIQRCADIYAKSVEGLSRALAERMPAPGAIDPSGRKERRFLPEARQIPPAELKAFYDEMGDCFARRVAIETVAETRWRQAGMLAARKIMRKSTKR
jgi:hypothetical protein